MSADVQSASSDPPATPIVSEPSVTDNVDTAAPIAASSPASKLIHDDNDDDNTTTTSSAAEKSAVAPPSRDVLRRRVTEYLQTADPTTTTLKSVIAALSAEFACDLSAEKKFIKYVLLSATDTETSTDKDTTNDEDQANADNAHTEVTQEESDRLMAESLQAEFGSRPRRAAAPQAKPRTKRKRADDDAAPKKPKRPPPEMQVSPQLAAFLSSFSTDGPITAINRYTLIKKLWEYIKSHNLQDPNNGQWIICDESLRSIFGAQRKRVNMLTMNKLLTKHLFRAGE